MTKTDTAAQRLQDLLTKRTELQGDFDSLGARLRDEQERDVVEALLEGTDIDELIRPVVDERDKLREKIELLDRAIREQSEIVEAARVIQGREARERMRPEWERHLRAYHAGIAQSVEALKEIAKLNGGLHAQGFAPFPHVFFPGWRISQENFAQQDRLFADICKQHGVDIE